MLIKAENASAAGWKDRNGLLNKTMTESATAATTGGKQATTTRALEDPEDSSELALNLPTQGRSGDG
ncbi:hypothetical protein ColTof3_10939 [Colletotrichum tofieldiae]|nr:hypothetical protein ColTof3_10939 [Colletotrichum tofieldiae]